MRRFLLPLASIVVTAPAMAQSLPTDPRLVTGELENGLSYIILQHATPPGRASAWMHVSSGSMNETEAQRGIAHFLEHMAFNGSENFPPGTVINFFESLGLTFGRHQNAFTSFDQTTYQLSLPDNKPETLSKGLMFFADVNSRLLLKPEEIDAERGVILNEKTSRKSGQQRIQEYMLERTAPGSLYARRLPIGVDETLNKVQRQDFVDYYTKWYGPANSTVIVVADMDPAVVAGVIKDRFNTQGKKKERPADQDPGIKKYPKSFAVVASDTELSRATVSIMKNAPADAPTTTEPQLREDWVADLAQSAFNRRMADLVAKGGSPFQNAYAGAAQSGRILKSSTVVATGMPDKWPAMLDAVALEMQRAREFGLSDREIEDARTDTLSGLEQAARTEPTLPATAHLNRINGSLASGRTLMSAQQRLDLGRKLLPGISPAECSAWFKKEFTPDAVLFSVQLPKGADNPSESDVLERGLKAIAVTPTPMEQVAVASTLMDTIPTAGTYTAQSTHEAAAVWTGTLSNNVIVHHRFMDTRKDSVSISITLYGGELSETAADRGITQAAAIAFGGGGGRRGGGGGNIATKSRSSTDIRSLMTGKNTGVGGRSGMEAIQLSVSGNPEDIESGLQLAHLMLTEPLIEQVAFDRWRQSMLQMLSMIDKTPQQAFGKAEAEARYPAGEVRTKALTPAQVEAISREAAQARLEKLVATSPIEVAIVGDISRERAMELVARYIGSLPKRDAVTPATNAALRKLPAPTGPREARVEVDTVTEQASASVGFYGPDRRELDDVRAMTLATRILSTRMVAKIREKEALVYSISCGLSPGTVFPGYGLVRAGAPCQPANADKLPSSIVQVFEEFAKSGPTPEEVEKARKQMANTLDESMKEPGFWASRLESLTYDNIGLDAALQDPAAYQSVTVDQIKAVFNKYYSPSRTVTVVVKPKDASKPGG